METLSKDIIVQASLGDLKAFEKIYRRFASLVYGVAFRITNKKEDAKEVSQDVFVKIHGKLKGFRFQSSFKTWIYRITVNTAINMQKKRSKERILRSDNYETYLKTEPAREERRGDVDEGHNKKVLADLLESLNADQRACIVLREIEGLSYTEISECLGININTVRSRLKRARLALLRCAKKEAV